MQICDKTLYVSDLDGTLLRSDQTLSLKTIETINALVARGMLFSYATARSLIAAAPVTKGITPTLPVIVYNGAFIVEAGTQKQLLSNAFTVKERDAIARDLTERGIFPIVFAFRDGRECFSYCEDAVTPGMRHFIERRKDDVRRNPVSKETLFDGEVFYISCIDEEETLTPAYEAWRERYPCVLAKDIYSQAPWLDILPPKATKANAVLALKEMLGCTRVVCFGDGKNDLPMFRIADECYAVANADPELKAVATGVIEANDADGVANWLARRFSK